MGITEGHWSKARPRPSMLMRMVAASRHPRNSSPVNCGRCAECPWFCKGKTQRVEVIAAELPLKAKFLTITMREPLYPEVKEPLTTR